MSIMLIIAITMIVVGAGAMAMSFFIVGRNADEPEPIEQPDIRLTIIQSEHIRSHHVERD